MSCGNRVERVNEPIETIGSSTQLKSWKCWEMNLYKHAQGFRNLQCLLLLCRKGSVSSSENRHVDWIGGEY